MASDNFVNRVEISGGKVQGFIQENHGTVTQNFITQVSELISGQVSVAEKDLTREQYRQRTVLLSKVKDYWIKGVLEKSLYTEAMIELGLEERSDLVERPFIGFEELSEESGESLPTGTGATEFFDQIGDGRTLLILGEPGSGKTITLLKLAQNLIACAEDNVNRLIPVVFNLSSWAIRRQTIADWLLDELWKKYGVAKAIGKDWVEHQRLILLLDSLDEVKIEVREACVQAINQFMEDNGQTEVVVCSRIAEYEALSARLRLRGSIFIRSLTPEQINQYLDRVGEQLQAVKTLLQEDNELQDLAKSPLTLSVMTLAYRGKKIEEIPQTGSIKERRQHLFDTYINRMFSQERIGKPREYKPPYQNQQTILWLTWLAKHMTKESQTVFLIENLQPRWLKTNSQKLLYVLAVPLFIISVIVFLEYFTGIPITPEQINLFVLLLILLINALIWSSIMALSLISNIPPNLYFIIKCIAAFIIPVKWEEKDWFINSNIINKILFFNLFTPEIEIVESVSWSLSIALKTLRITFMRDLFFLVAKYIIILMLFLMPLSVLINALNGDKLIGSPFFYGFFYMGSLFYFSLLSMNFLFSGINIKVSVTKTVAPNEGIWKTLANIIPLSIMGFIIGFAFGFPMTTLPLLLSSVKIKQNLTDIVLSLSSQLSMSILLAIMFATLAVGACIKHFVLRIILYRTGYIPWNYASFLNYASDRIFLRKVGGSYIFIHRMLQEHFARMNLV